MKTVLWLKSTEDPSFSKKSDRRRRRNQTKIKKLLHMTFYWTYLMPSGKIKPI